MKPLSKFSLILCTSLFIAACDEDKIVTLEKPAVLFNLAPAQVERSFYYWDSKTVEQLKSLSKSYQQLGRLAISYDMVSSGKLPEFPDFSGFDSASLSDLKSKYQQVLFEATELKEEVELKVEMDQALLKEQVDQAKEQHSTQTVLLSQYLDKLTPLRQKKADIEAQRDASDKTINDLLNSSTAAINKIIVDEGIPVNILKPNALSHFRYQANKPCKAEGMSIDGSYIEIMLHYQNICFMTYFKMDPQYSPVFVNNADLSSLLSANFLGIIQEQIAKGEVDVEKFKNTGYQHELSALNKQIRDEEIIARNKNNGVNENQLSYQVEQAERNYFDLVMQLDRYKTERDTYLEHEFNIKFRNMLSLELLYSEMAVFYGDVIDRISQQKSAPAQAAYQKISVDVKKAQPYVLIEDKVTNYTQYFFVNTANLVKNKKYADKDTILLDDLQQDRIVTINHVKSKPETLPVDIIYTLSQID
ncbi:hypothetical protein [Pasteurella testudinis]|uniref:hypothetical protein n=1 Tax=Pasteurella testudinis TaxID=761 RepID=UPI004059CAFB